MGCWRFDIRRLLFKYVDETLPFAAIDKTERHLEGCPACRERVNRLRNALSVLDGLSVIAPPDDHWAAIRRGIRESAPRPAAVPMRPVFGRYQFAAVGAVLLLTVGALATVFYLPESREKRERESAGLSGGLPRKDLREFTPVPIARVGQNRQPHIVTEGYVVAMKINEEEDDGDYVFKLVDDQDDPNHFVVCEIIQPISVAPPRPGSKVRVYGVSRYDDKADHKWQEVHPVLNIETVNP